MICFATRQTCRLAYAVHCCKPQLLVTRTKQCADYASHAQLTIPVLIGWFVQLFASVVAFMGVAIFALPAGGCRFSASLRIEGLKLTDIEGLKLTAIERVWPDGWVQVSSAPGLSS